MVQKVLCWLTLSRSELYSSLNLDPTSLGVSDWTVFSFETSDAPDPILIYSTMKHERILNAKKSGINSE